MPLKKGFITIFLLTLSIACLKNKPSELPPKSPLTHQAHLAAGWYPQEKTVLSSTIASLLQQAQSDFAVHTESSNVKALIVPHAGYGFSGLCAATAFQTLLESGQPNSRIKRVIVMAPSHHAFLHGIALPDYTEYKTPLGTIPVDAQAIATLAKDPSFKENGSVHAQEHALEVELPFLQKTIAQFELVPLILGHLRYEDYPGIISQLNSIIDDTTLMVVSSDFTHHGKNFDYNIFHSNIIDNIRQVDSRVLQGIMEKNINVFNRALRETGSTVCGQEPIRLFLALLEGEPYQTYYPQLTCYYTSAHQELIKKNDIKTILDPVPDEAGEHCVSYMGIIFTNDIPTVKQHSDRMSDFEKRALLASSQSYLTNLFASPKKPTQLCAPIQSNHLTYPQGTFVTLNTKGGGLRTEVLRGCIGRIVSDQPLYQTVLEMTEAAALHDSRFSPVGKNELDNLIIDITILTPPYPVDDYRDIILGKHGIILKREDPETKAITTSSVFLPQVPLSLGWDLKTTLEQLAQKAGLDKNGWKTNCHFEVFEGFEIKE